MTQAAGARKGTDRRIDADRGTKLSAWVVKCARPTCPNVALADSPFCGTKCRKADNRAQWKSAPAAIVDVIGKWIEVDRARLLPSVQRAFDWCGWTVDGRERRRALMTMLELTWVSEAREWRKGE